MKGEGEGSKKGGLYALRKIKGCFSYEGQKTNRPWHRQTGVRSGSVWKSGHVRD